MEGARERGANLSQRKRCCMCRRAQPLGEFNRRRASPDGLQRHCRACSARASREHYRRHAADHKQVVARNNGRYRARNRQLLLDYLREHPCVDCGITDPVVLDFDHVTLDKLGDVSRMAARPVGVRRLLAELAKCEVRCVNCHRRRTARVFGWSGRRDQGA